MAIKYLEISVLPCHQYFKNQYRGRIYIFCEAAVFLTFNLIMPHNWGKVLKLYNFLSIRKHTFRLNNYSIYCFCFSGSCYSCKQASSGNPLKLCVNQYIWNHKVLIYTYKTSPSHKHIPWGQGGRMLPHSFLTSALDGTKQITSHPGYFTPKKEPWYPLHWRPSGPQTNYIDKMK